MYAQDSWRTLSVFNVSPFGFFNVRVYLQVVILTSSCRIRLNILNVLFYCFAQVTIFLDPLLRHIGPRVMSPR